MSFLTGVQDAIRSYYCVATDVVQNAYDLFRPVLFGGLNLPVGLVDPVIDWLVSPRRTICNNEPNYRAQLPVPFTGGQCPVIYRPAYTIVQYDALGNVTRSDSDPGATRIWGEITRPLDLYFVSGVGSQINVDYYGHGSGEFPRLASEGISYSQIAPFNANTRSFELVNLRYIREDGAPDNCGDPPIVIPPPVNNYNIHNTNVTYVDNSGNTVNVPVTLIYGQAFIDANFDIQVPVKVSLTPKVSFTANLNINTGDIKLNLAPTVDLSGGTYNIGFGGDNRTSSNTTNYYVSNPPPPAPDGSESDDIPPPGSVTQEKLIRGVIVTVTETSGSTEGVFFQPGGNPDIYIPNLGYVQFAIRVGGSISWSSDKPVKSLRSFVPCDWMGGAVDVQGTPRPGVAWTLTPVYSTVS